MASAIASGWVLDGILALMGAEAAVLAALWRAGRRGVPPGALLPNLLSGMCLLLAMRTALAGAWWGWISLPLLAAGVLHGVDLRRQWRSN